MRYLLGFTVAVLAVTVNLNAATTSSLSQYGITWIFDGQYEYGTFANGDYWVIGPVTITAISPASTNSSGRTKNGSMINPGLGMTQGYDSAMYGTYGPAYSSSMNKALDISASNPLTVPNGSSLISSVSLDDAGVRPQLKSAAILTVLAQVPPDGSFRPPYFGSDKTVRYNKSQLNYGALPRLAPVAGTPTLSSMAANFQRPWLEHVLSWTGRYCHPQDNMPDYGRDMCNEIGAAALSLLLDYSDAQKETLLIRLTQYGIDLYAIASGGGVWEDLGGHMHGRKLPILMAGLVLDDEDMLAIGTTRALKFQEDRQTWYVTQYDVGRPLYTADGRPREEYIQSDVGIPEWGEQHYRQPERDGRNWNAYYRTIVGGSILSHVLTANILSLRDEWQWEALFDYIDRYWGIEQNNIGGSNEIPVFPANMWKAYRDYTHEIIGVRARHTFYNNSCFDGNDPAANVNDDNTIAIDKLPLLPGNTAGNENYTSYDKGINGIMIDIIDPPATITAADFVFQIGNNSLPDSWPTGPAPTSITARPGAGADNSTRITITFPDYAIRKQWLKVTVLANDNTGLTENDVFYFGNAVGDTLDATDNAIVDATDEIAGRNDPKHFLEPASIDNHHDHNRDCKVDATDEIISRNNATTVITALRMLTAPQP